MLDKDADQVTGKRSGAQEGTQPIIVIFKVLLPLIAIGMFIQAMIITWHETSQYLANRAFENLPASPCKESMLFGALSELQDYLILHTEGRRGGSFQAIFLQEFEDKSCLTEEIDLFFVREGLIRSSGHGNREQYTDYVTYRYEVVRLFYFDVFVFDFVSRFKIDIVFDQNGKLVRTIWGATGL